MELALLNGRVRGGAGSSVGKGKRCGMGSCSDPPFLESELGPPPIECLLAGEKVWFAALVDCGTASTSTTTTPTIDGFALLLLLLLGESHSNAEDGETPYTSPSCRRQAGGTAPCRLC